jgi:ribosomal protein S18 acetylase RimI-like enzyme
MLIKSIPFKNVYMKIEAADLKKISVPTLPTGFRYRFFQPGDEQHWAQIETAVGEFETEADALRYFTQAYLINVPALQQRLVFVVNGEDQPVATANAYFIDTPQYGHQEALQWVSVRPDYQKLGLGKAVVSKALALFPTLAPDSPVMLHTQTWSYPAILLYHRLGFYIAKTEHLASHSYRNGGVQFVDHPSDFEAAKAVLAQVLTPEQLTALYANAR